MDPLAKNNISLNQIFKWLWRKCMRNIERKNKHTERKRNNNWVRNGTKPYIPNWKRNENSFKRIGSIVIENMKKR